MDAKQNRLPDKITDLHQIRRGLDSTRDGFRQSVGTIDDILDKGVRLFTIQVDLISKMGLSPDDDALRPVEVLITAFRRVVASYALLESGLSHEANMVLRNALELLLVAIDITHNSESLGEWKKSKADDLTGNDDNWYFKHSRIVTRIRENKRQEYPSQEQHMVLGYEGMMGKSISGEWKNISNVSLHARSYAQIAELIGGNGQFQLLGTKSVDNYEKDFVFFSAFLCNIVALLHGIPKFRAWFVQRGATLPEGQEFLDLYTAILESANAAVKRETISTPRDLELCLQAHGLGHLYNNASLPGNALIESFQISKDRWGDPMLEVTYKIPEDKQGTRES